MRARARRRCSSLAGAARRGRPRRAPGEARRTRARRWARRSPSASGPTTSAKAAQGRRGRVRRDEAARRRDDDVDAGLRGLADQRRRRRQAGRGLRRDVRGDRARAGHLEAHGGVFDITVGAFKGLWKFDEDMDGTLPDPAEVKKRLALDRLQGHRARQEEAARCSSRRRACRSRSAGSRRATRSTSASSCCASSGFTDFMMQAGGDMYVAGKKGNGPVGRRHPRSARPDGRDVRARADRGPLVLDVAATTSAASSRTASATTTSSIRGPASRRTRRAR